MKEIFRGKRSLGSRRVLLTAVVTGMLGVVGYVYIASRTADTHKMSGAATASVSPEFYATWKTYTSRFEGLTFKYPADWQLEEYPDEEGDSIAEYVTLRTSNDFSLDFKVYKIDYDSVIDCVHCAFRGVTPLQANGYGKQLFMVIDTNSVSGGPFPSLGISEYKERDNQKVKESPYYTSKTHPGYTVGWNGLYIKSQKQGSDFVEKSYDEFIKSPDVVTAKKILESIHY